MPFATVRTKKAQSLPAGNASGQFNAPAVNLNNNIDNNINQANQIIAASLNWVIQP